MRFDCTYFHNFRNLQAQRREWAPGFNLIIGPNGAGKTNFLEGLNLVSGWGPLENASKISDLVRWKGLDREERASLWARISGEAEAEIFASLSSRCTLKYDNRTIRAAGIRAIIPVLSFLSGHMAILKGSASHRRQLLDRVGALISSSYAAKLNDYRKILRQRTALLRRSRDTGVADRVLLPLGGWLWTAREEIAKLIGAALNVFRPLTDRELGVVFSRGGGGRAEAPLEDFRHSLAANREKERMSRISLVGPQRDDLKIVCDGRDAAKVLSRGQSRRVASALILASAVVVERSLGKRPVLIFDEVTSELDELGREATFSALTDTGYQIFAAATDALPHWGIEIHKMVNGRFISG